MPIDNNKPLDPLIQEFCELTGTSSANMSHTAVGISSSRVKEGKLHRIHHGIKIKFSRPGSASAGAIGLLRFLVNLDLVLKPLLLIIGVVNTVLLFLLMLIYIMFWII